MAPKVVHAPPIHALQVAVLESETAEPVSLLAPARQQLPALTGVRFLAAFQVVLYHWALWAAWPVPSVVKRLLGSGYASVGFFFALSGFILSYAQFGSRTAPMALRQYFVGRFSRVYPVYAVGLFLTLPYYLRGLSAGTQPSAWLLTVTAVPLLLQAFLPGTALAWNLPGWSLSAEAFFYALFPWLGRAISRLRVRQAFYLLAVCWALMLVPSSLTALLAPGSWKGWGLFDASWMNVLKYNPLLRLPEFVAGIAMGRLFRDIRVGAFLYRRGAVLEVVSLGAIVVVLAVGEESIPYPLLHNGLLLPAYVILILTLAAGRGVFSRLFSTKPFQILGNASYALYILHMPVIYLVASLSQHWLGARAGSHPVELLVTAAGAVGLSVLVFNLVEQPMHLYLRTLLGKPRQKEHKPFGPLNAA